MRWPPEPVRKPGDRVLVRGWSQTQDFIAVIEKRFCSGSSYLVRSEQSLYRIAGHARIDGRMQPARVERDFYGYIPADHVQPVTLLDELAQADRDILEC